MYRIQLQHKEFMVINKGPSLGMHDEGGEPGLVNRLRTETGLTLYPVHRLDKMTSGLVLLARTPEANRALSMAFAAREVSKQYLALSDRKPKKKQGWVKGDMQKGRGGSWMLARSLDNPAISWFDSVPVREGLRLYRIKPQTGKTHQIRVALKSIGAPILGDERYGGTAADPALRNVPITDVAALVDFAQAEKVALTVVGPEAPLAAGVVATAWGTSTEAAAPAVTAGLSTATACSSATGAASGLGA